MSLKLTAESIKQMEEDDTGDSDFPSKSDYDNNLVHGNNNIKNKGSFLI